MKRFGNTTAQTYDEQLTSLLHSNGSSSGNIDQYSVNSLQSVIENQGVFWISVKSGRFLYSCYSEYGCVVWDTLKSEIVGIIEVNI